MVKTTELILLQNITENGREVRIVSHGMIIMIKLSAPLVGMFALKHQQ